MTEEMPDADKSGTADSPARMMFLAVVLLAFVWIGLFVILPAVTGKPGVAQKMQSDLQQTPPEPR